MKTIKQIIKKIRSYQCTEGSEKDCELRSLIIRVDLLWDAFMLCDAHIRQFVNPKDAFKMFDDLYQIFKILDSSIKAVEKKASIGLEKISEYQLLQTLNIAFERKELLTKYEGKDKKFVENITKDVDEYVKSTYDD